VAPVDVKTDQEPRALVSELEKPLHDKSRSLLEVFRRRRRIVGRREDVPETRDLQAEVTRAEILFFPSDE
jgi:hypothetical protein